MTPRTTFVIFALLAAAVPARAANPAPKLVYKIDSVIATDCLKYVWDQFRANEGFDKGGGHAFYSHLYAAQGFYMAGDQYWDNYFPKTRDQLLAMQQPDGSWMGDGIG